MTNERNQDPQDPTRDQPPAKQYATPRPGQSGADHKKPRIPDQMETSEGDDENQIASAQGGYDEEASTRGATSSQSPGSGSRQPTGATGSGKPSGSTPGGHSGK